VALTGITAALDKAWARNTRIIPWTARTRLAIFSDIHRGAGDWADDFNHNSRIFACALDYYWRNNFTYAELGDGDELYENRRLTDIVLTHGDIFGRLQRFQARGRMCYLTGNHNGRMADPAWRRKELAKARHFVPGLFEGLKVTPTAILGDRVFLFHGHQGDVLSLPFFEPLGRLLVRYVWRFLQESIGFKDPTSAAQNVRKRTRLEKAFTEWARVRGRVAVSGHTHRPMFLSLSKQQRLAGDAPKPFYFNPGSGVHPRCITCLEVRGKSLVLVKWHILTDGPDRNRPRVSRRVLPGCRTSMGSLLSRLDRGRSRSCREPGEKEA
jgi:UDP-2,3-diacylglucosamine pyrophosphatase LpxH